MEEEVLKENAKLVEEVLDIFIKRNLSYSKAMATLTNCLITVHNNFHDSTLIESVRCVIDKLQQLEEGINNNSAATFRIDL